MWNVAILVSLTMPNTSGIRRIGIGSLSFLPVKSRLGVPDSTNTFGANPS
jgi:hypothetical protein